MNRKRLLLSIWAIAALSVLCSAQVQRRELRLPKVEGYELLRCDFHMHTVFSDGMVWPTTRVDEAVGEGIDAIALTDHIEYRPKLKEFTSADHNHSYELASKYAADRGIILIKGSEVTRRMAPGHFNAIFIDDANAFQKFVNPNDWHDGANIAQTLDEGKKQNAFVFWNHPWFQHKENIAEWAAIHEELYQKKLISGIEVVNGNRYDPTVLQWCLDKNLTVMANTDIHTPMRLDKGEYRTMTIVFAKEHTAQAIKEALEARRTVAYSSNAIYGKEELIRQIVAGSLQVKARRIGPKSGMVEITNSSSIPFSMTVTSTDGVQPSLNGVVNDFTAFSSSTTLIPVDLKNLKSNQGSFTVAVTNAQVGANKPLQYTITVAFDK